MSIGRAVRLFWAALCLALLAALLAPAGGAAQEVLVPLQLSFSDPGARSMGLGGAFVALADDATAALANPAGLVQLTRPEVSIEVRRTSYSTRYTRRGRVEGLPSGFGIDTVAGLESARSETEADGVSFLSLAYPKGRWSVAFYRHQLADLEFRGATQGLVGGGSQCCQVRLFDQQSLGLLDLVAYGVTGAVRVSDRLSLGLGVTYHDVSLLAEATMFLPDDTPAGILGPTSFAPERSLLREAAFSDDTDWTMTAGVLWRLSRGWRLGGTYRQGATVEFGSEITAGEAGNYGEPPGGVLFRVLGLEVELPGLLGLGFAYRAPNDRLTVSFQWDRVDYSSIIDSLPVEDRAIDDVEELHLGAEYVFLDTTPIVAVRLGAWLDPDHQFRATTDDPFERALLPGGQDELHTTAGLGLAFERFQLDLGIDLAGPVDTVSLSAIYSF